MPRQIESLRRSAKFQSALDAVLKDLQQPGTIETESLAHDATTETPPLSGSADRVGSALSGDVSLESLDHETAEFYDLAEAIVLERLRPPYLIENDEITIAGDYDREDLIRDNKTLFEAAARNVGRVDLLNDRRGRRFVGTGWVIDRQGNHHIAVTNRHVAETFARWSHFAGAYQMHSGAFDEPMEVRLDYIRQHETSGLRRRADMVEVLFIAPSRGPDIAILKLDLEDEVDPIELDTRPLEIGSSVAAIGYPASDGGRNDPALMRRLFNDIYDVKRFAPGEVDQMRGDQLILTDYTTLGGNSGSAVIALDAPADKGKVVGLHFAGAFRDANYAVTAKLVEAAWLNTKNLVLSMEGAEIPPEAPTTNLTGREGYKADFLGTEVPLPTLSADHQADIAPVSDDADGVLKYTNFSVIQSKSRRLPRVTAVNIDGAQSQKLKRKGTWSLDGRIAKAHQIGNDLYYKNPLDRGHMVRRRDPGWGPNAQQGEKDTFHYTNCAPQHEDLNQRDWVGLEDYVMEHAETKDFKVSVFTGPVFRDSDKRLKAKHNDQEVQIPEEFWKVVVTEKEDGSLSATGYILSHGEMIKSMVEAAFVYGEYKTYQVQIARIEAETGLDFGPLRDADPLGQELTAETSFADAVRAIDGIQDVRL